MYRAILVFSATLLITYTQALSAQNFNIDLGDLSTGTPASYGAASGQTGTWNIIDTLGSTALVSTTGAASGATVNTNSSYGFGSDGNYPGPHSDLLGDMIWGEPAPDQPTSTDWSLTFVGLPGATYDVYYYAPSHSMPTGEIRINNVPVPSLPGDPVDTALVKGVNWQVHTSVLLSGGILRITGVNSDPSQFSALGGLAGLQLVQVRRVPIDPPLPGC